MRLTAHQPSYLCGARLLHKIASADTFVVIDSVPHSHNSWENRNVIRTGQGSQWLTVPVLHGAKILAETRIAPGNWARKHWRAIEMNYQRAPFWSDYVIPLELIYEEMGGSLTQAAIETACRLAFHLECMGTNLAWRSTSEIKPEGEGWRMILSLCQKLNADTFLFGSQGRDYMTPEAHEAFRKAGVKPLFQEYSPVEYKQCYDPFLPNMSALDILLNCGPEAGRDVIMRGGRFEE